MDLAQLLELIERIGTADAPTDEELTSAQEVLAALLREALSSPPDLEAGTAIRGALDDIKAELAARVDEAEQVSAKAAELLDGYTEADAEGDEFGDVGGDHDAADTPPEVELEAPDEEVLVSANTIDLRTATRRTAGRVAANAVPEPTGDIRAVGMAGRRRRRQSEHQSLRRR